MLFRVFKDEFDNSKCGPREIKLLSGRCEECKAYRYPDLNGTRCVSDEGRCASNQYLSL